MGLKIPPNKYTKISGFLYAYYKWLEIEKGHGQCSQDQENKNKFNKESSAFITRQLLDMYIWYQILISARKVKELFVRT